MDNKTDCLERIARSIIETTDTSIDVYLRKIQEQESKTNALAHLVDVERGSYFL
jgi:hypothetical protein